MNAAKPQPRQGAVALRQPVGRALRVVRADLNSPTAAPMGPVTSDDVNRWYHTPNAAGYTLSQRMDMLAKRYRNVHPEGADGVREQLDEAVVDAMSKFDPSRATSDSKREAFEALLSRKWQNTIINIQRDQHAQKRGPGAGYHVDVHDPQHDVGESSDPTEQFRFVSRQLAESLPPELRPGFDVLVDGLERGDTMDEIIPGVEAASGMSRNTFFGRLRKNKTFQEWAAVAL